MKKVTCGWIVRVINQLITNGFSHAVILNVISNDTYTDKQ